MWQSVIVLPAKLSLVPVLSTTVEEKKKTILLKCHRNDNITNDLIYTKMESMI